VRRLRALTHRNLGNLRKPQRCDGRRERIRVTNMSRPGARREDVAQSAKPPPRPGGPAAAAAAGRPGNREPVPGAGPDRIRQPLGWLPVTTFVLSVIGLADSGYQVYTHFSSTGLLGCSSNGDPCVLVQSSSYAWIFGIPVAVLGAAFYAAMVVICSPLGGGGRGPARRCRGRNAVRALPGLP
jgi:Vitamin K epoxide reductase family